MILLESRTLLSILTYQMIHKPSKGGSTEVAPVARGPK